MRSFHIVTTALLLTAPLFSADLAEQAPNQSTIRVVAVEPTPEGDHVETRIVFPKRNEVKTSLPLTIQIRLEGYVLGTKSDFQRAKEIYNDPQGQGLTVLIDDQAYFYEHETFIDALDDNENYYDHTLNFKAPLDLDSGMHTIRAFPTRSFKEGLKGDGSFASSVFYYYDGSEEDPNKNLNQPYLTYNQPQDSVEYQPRKPILLDFYVTNARLSKDGYKVRLTINNTKRLLTQWVPYYIYGLTPGEHFIRLELLDSRNRVVPGQFNDVKRTITVY